MTKYREIDIRKLKTTSIQKRGSKVSVSQGAQPVGAGASFRTFWESLPGILAGSDLKTLVENVAKAHLSGKPVLWMMGAHVIKVGLNPVIVQLIKNGWVQGIVMNGAGAVHDAEIAYFGETSEDVQAELKLGQFGTAVETADLLNGAADTGAAEQLGFGEALGRQIIADKPEYLGSSILGQAYAQDVPVTIHVALGTDIVHQHVSARGTSIGDVSLRDFRILVDLVSRIGNGGVVLLFGSSVVLPEVFIKALNVARNITGPIENFTTANFDMIRHYRPMVNVVERPTEGSGTGMSFVGHHEIMLPLLAAAVEEEKARLGVR